MAVPTSITQISTTASSNSPAGSDSIGNPGTIDDYFRGYGAVFRAETLNKSWERWNDTPTYIGATQFSVTGDKTSRYVVGRRVKCTVTAGTVYGYISVSAFSTVTTITVVLDSGSLDSGLSEVQLGPEINAVAMNLTAASSTFTLNRTATGGGRYALYRWGTAGTLKWQAGIDGDASDSRWTLYSLAGSVYALNVESDGRIWGAALHNNSGAVTGTTNQYIASGTYTPTITGVTNVTSSNNIAAFWIRVGNVVYVNGGVSITPTAVAATAFGISLPIASNLAASSLTAPDCAGVLSGVGAVGVGYIEGDATNDRASATFTAGASGSGLPVRFTFSYIVL